MLEAGCDIRFTFKRCSVTQNYHHRDHTQVSVGKLQQIHAATHPARLQRQRRRRPTSPAGTAAEGAAGKDYGDEHRLRMALSMNNQ
jgi:hypothetical protein